MARFVYSYEGNSPNNQVLVRDCVFKKTRIFSVEKI